jgi:hypothetical protein
LLGVPLNLTAATTLASLGEGPVEVPKGSLGWVKHRVETLVEVEFWRSDADPGPEHAWVRFFPTEVGVRHAQQAELVGWYLQCLEDGSANARYGYIHYVLGDLLPSRHADEELVWEFVDEAIDAAESDKVLGSLGAGLLEDLIQGWPEQFVDRIEVRARQSPRFRHALRISWGWPDSVADRLQAAANVERS